jgi:hypothetical protein
MQFRKATLFPQSGQTLIETSALDVIVVASIQIESMQQRVQSAGRLVRGELDVVFVYTLASLVLNIQMESGI